MIAFSSEMLASFDPFVRKTGLLGGTGLQTEVTQSQVSSDVVEVKKETASADWVFSIHIRLAPGLYSLHCAPTHRHLGNCVFSRLS